MICMTLSLCALETGIYCGGNYVGSLHTWITSDGYLRAQNTSNRSLSVTLNLGGTRNITVTVPANITNQEGHNCGKVATGNNVQYSVKSISCN